MQNTFQYLPGSIGAACSQRWMQSQKLIEIVKLSIVSHKGETEESQHYRGIVCPGTDEFFENRWEAECYLEVVFTSSQESCVNNVSNLHLEQCQTQQEIERQKGFTYLMFIDFFCQVDFKVELLQDEPTALKELLKNPTSDTVAPCFYLLGCAPPNFKQTNVFRAASSETKTPWIELMQ